MKKTILPFAAFALISLSSCQNTPNADHAQTTEAQTVQTTDATNEILADVAQTKIEFVGSHPTSQRHGIFMLKEGKLLMKEGKVQGGNFVFDINTLKITSMDDDKNNMLASHLKSDEFFDVAKYPTATFEITSIKEGVENNGDVLLKDATHTVLGNLTIKGVTKNISFPAVINQNGNIVSANANFNVNRLDWGLTYGNDESLKDKFIKPTINISLNLVAGNNS